MLDFASRGAIVDKAEDFKKIEDEISELNENIRMKKPILKGISFSIGNLSHDNFVDFNPNRIGKPIITMMGQIRTKHQNSDTIMNCIKLFNEMKYWTEVDNLDKEQTKPDLDPQRKEELKPKREALAKTSSPIFLGKPNENGQKGMI